MSKKGKKNKRKLNKKRFFKFIIFVFLIILFIYGIVNVKIKNIYISGNDFLSDQQIIDIANIKNYPNSLNNNSMTIKKRLENNTYILSAKVYKTGFINKVHIKIEENYPLFYYQPENKYVLYNGDKIDDKSTVVTVINKIPDTVYNKFLNLMQRINKDILNRMSEIEYKPNDVDDERFFILMNDGNYIYITLNRGLTLNKYFEMILSFDNKKGILYLDSGEYFDVFEE